MEFESFFRNKIESILITASWVERVHTMLGLNGVSQVWGDKPEWYFWIDGAPGAYALEFESGGNLTTDEAALLYGRFLLKCFPAIGSDAFRGLSPQEREIRSSNRFDGSGTPRLDAKADIPEAYFAVGGITIILNAADTAAGFSFDSLDEIRWKRAVTDRLLFDGNGRKTEILRSLAGWRIGYPFFDCLIGLYAFHSRQAPAFQAASQNQGFECCLDRNQAVEVRHCDDTRQLSASVLFFAPADSDEWVRRLWRAHLDSSENVLFEQPLGHLAGRSMISAGDPHVTVNPIWRELAHSDLKSSLASTCGCCDHGQHA